MICRSLQDGEIDFAFTLAMQNTVLCLVDEGLMEKEAAIEFLDSHVCLSVTDEKIWWKIRKWLGMKEDPSSARPAVFKIAYKKAVPDAQDQSNGGSPS
jgi:hypothetical protein